MDPCHFTYLPLIQDRLEWSCGVSSDIRNNTAAVCACLTKGPARPQHNTPPAYLPHKCSTFILKGAQHQIVAMALKSQILLKVVWFLSSQGRADGLDRLYTFPQTYTCLARYHTGILSLLKLALTSPIS